MTQEGVTVADKIHVIVGTKFRLVERFLHEGKKIMKAINLQSWYPN